MKSMIIISMAIGIAWGQYGSYYSPGSFIRIRSQTQDGPGPDGSYRWSYDTENCISAEEDGRFKNFGSETQSLEARGGFRYTAPDNTPISLTYIADENGFQPSGSHLPTPPPIPVAIQRALEWIRTHPDPRYQPDRY